MGASLIGDTLAVADSANKIRLISMTDKISGYVITAPTQVVMDWASMGVRISWFVPIVLAVGTAGVNYLLHRKLQALPPDRTISVPKPTIPTGLSKKVKYHL